MRVALDPFPLVLRQSIAKHGPDHLASVCADARSVGLLRRTRYSHALLLACHLVQADATLADAAEALGLAQAAAPDEVVAVLTYPWVSVWASAACRNPWTADDHRHFRAVAAAASLRAHIEDVPLVSTGRDHRGIVLPSLGVLAVPVQSKVRLTRALLEGPRWQPVRDLEIDLGPLRTSMTVDDLDPYRNCHGAAVADRLAPAAWRRWRDLLTEAWRLLATHAPSRGAELAAGLASVVPLRPNVTRAGMSATHGDAFGGFAASLAGPGDLAATMVHEFHHSKLNALLGLVDLYGDDGGRQYFAPWRRDPRPLGGLLQGIYAFTATADTWNALRAEPVLSSHATRQFAAIRLQVFRVLPDLVGSGALTDAGRRFTSILAATVSRQMSEPIPADVARVAERQLMAVERAWYQRHGGIGRCGAARN